MTINVKRVFDALNLDVYHSSRFINLPKKDEMSYDELNAWYKTRLRHHRAINIFFHALAILLTGPFLHLIWFLAIRPWYSHPNWLMTNRHFSSAH